MAIKNNVRMIVLTISAIFVLMLIISNYRTRVPISLGFGNSISIPFFLFLIIVFAIGALTALIIRAKFSSADKKRPK